MKRRHRGFSLVELSVSLAVMGAMGLAVWRFLPLSRELAQGQPVALQQAQAQWAVEGFLMRSHRLPCPDTDGDGLENCTGGMVGQLAWRDLGLTQSFAVLRYGVYRAGSHDLAQALERQIPLLPPGYAPHPLAGLNGLDLCFALRAAARSPGTAGALTAGGVEVAYALAHPGINGQFQGLNATMFDLPGRASDANYDDVVATTGLTELSGRLSCPTRLGEANAAARAAYAAYDMDRNAQQFLEFRNFAYQVRITNRNFAIANEGIAIVDLAIAVAGAVTAVSVAANSVGLGAGVVVAAAVPVLASGASLTAASLSLTMAVIAELKAKAQSEGAAELRATAAAALVRAGTAAIALDTKGINP